MAKTVNATVIFTRDGKSEVANFDKLGYASFVAIQSAVVAALASLSAWAVQRVAVAVDGIEPKSKSGEENVDVRMEMRSDHGDGSSEFAIGFTGLGVPEADEIVGALKGAIDSVMKP